MMIGLPNAVVSASGSTSETPTREQVEQQLRELRSLPVNTYRLQKIARLEEILRAM